MKHVRITLLSALLLSSFTASAKQEINEQDSTIYAAVCHKTSEAEVRNLFNRWNDSLKTLSPEKVTANYSNDAVLLPTVSNTPRTTHAEIDDYFVHFLQKHPQGVINKSHVKIGCDKAYDVGVYTFALKGADGKVSHVVARYSFVYEYKNGQWLITHHHSSAMPEKVAAH